MKSFLMLTQSVLAGILSFLPFNLDALNSSVFYQKLQEPTPQWMQEQIEHDLAPFRKELSREYLDELFIQKHLTLVRVQVKQGQLTVQKSKAAATSEAWITNLILPNIYELHRLIGLPDIDFVFIARDFLKLHNLLPCQGADEAALPIFIMSKCQSDPGLILIPDWFALNGYKTFQILHGNQLFPWESKLAILFFRGSDSGAWDRSMWRNAPRPKLVALSLEYPDLINARFSSLLTYEESNAIRAIMEKEGFVGNYISMSDHPRYKYLMDIDGHCAAAPRFPTLLHSNSVVFKNITSSLLWFYPKIKPYVHFIPVAEDLSDLLTQLEWAKSHDEECKQISNNARQLAVEILSQESAYLYLYRLLEAYSKKQTTHY